MKTDEVSNTLNTTPKNNAIVKSTSHMTQKVIFDKVKDMSTSFVIISDANFDKNEWIVGYKFLEMANEISDKPSDYPLKKTFKGNADENKKSQDGKALQVIVDGNIVNLAVCAQVFGETWKISHTHTIDKVIFDAYVLVLKNDSKVKELEKESKSPKNFSMNLV